MKRAFLLSLLLSTLVYAAPVTVINGSGEIAEGVVYTLLNAVAVASTGTVSSNLVDQKRGGFFGLWYSCTSVSGTSAASIAWHESPTTEANDFVSVVTVNAAVTEATGITAISPPPMRYGRVVVTGTGANPADTLCTVKLYGAGP
jgi:hypothetical protein